MCAIEELFSLFIYMVPYRAPERASRISIYDQMCMWTKQGAQDHTTMNESKRTIEIAYDVRLAIK